MSRSLIFMRFTCMRGFAHDEFSVTLSTQTSMNLNTLVSDGRGSSREQARLEKHPCFMDPGCFWWWVTKKIPASFQCLSLCRHARTQLQITHTHTPAPAARENEREKSLRSVKLHSQRNKSVQRWNAGSQTERIFG